LSGLIHVWATNKCGGGAAQTLAVAVTAVPDKPTVTADSINVCAGATDLIYSVEKVEGVTYTWTVLGSYWSINSGQGSNSITVQAGTANGTFKVTPKNACGVTGPFLQWTVTVMSAPDQPTQSGTWVTENVCTGTSTIYTVNPVAGAIGYTWSVSGTGWVFTPTNDASATITAGSGPGTITVLAYNECRSSKSMTQRITVMAKPATPELIEGAAGVCINSEAVYTAASVAGADGYVWTLPSDWQTTKISGRTIYVKVGTSTTPSTISVKATNGCATSDARTLTVTASSKPQLTPTGPINFSKTSMEQYDTFTASIATTVPGATGYKWTLPYGLTGSSSTTSITIAATGAGTYSKEQITVAALNGGCAGPSLVSSQAISVVPLSIPTGTVRDDEGYSYKTSTFGAAGQWMTENLRTKKILPLYDGTSTIADAPMSYYPNDDPNILTDHPEYGLLYTWAVLNGICPTEWHVPSTAEFNQLFAVLDAKAGGYSVTKLAPNTGEVGKKMKSDTHVSPYEAGFPPRGASTPITGFNALLVGFRVFEMGMHMNSFGTSATFWHSNYDSSKNKGCSRTRVHCSFEDAYINPNTKNCMYSVRYKKDQ
jgi:uncharacterized protein (TIGR02145 family)